MSIAPTEFIVILAICLVCTTPLVLFGLLVAFLLYTRKKGPTDAV
jgi:hypothetical protein